MFLNSSGWQHYRQGFVLILVYLPGHPPYYAAAASIEAKIYSNSMMAMLNSRIKPVSNALAPATPTLERISEANWINFLNIKGRNESCTAKEVKLGLRKCA